MAMLRVELLLRQLIYQPNPVWCCKLEQPRREVMCFKGGASPYFIRQYKQPTYVTKDLKVIHYLKTENTAVGILQV